MSPAWATIARMYAARQSGLKREMFGYVRGGYARVLERFAEVLEAAGVHSLAIPVAVGAVIGAGAFSVHERHHRRALDAYSPEAVDRAGIVVRSRAAATRK